MRWQHAGVAVAGLLGLALAAPPVLMLGVVGGGAPEIGGACAGDVVVAAGASQDRLDQRQRTVAETIVEAGHRLGMPPRALVVALAVAHQESGFRNYANDGRGSDLHPSQRGIERSLALPHDAIGTDHGSLGVFQQQWPWWGTMPELMDPATAATRFYTALTRVPGWQEMAITDAGQAVQRSAFPQAYADDVPLALALLGLPALGEGGVEAASLDSAGSCVTSALHAGRVAFPLPPDSGYRDLANWGDSGSHWAQRHTGTDLAVGCGTPVLAATDGTVAVRTDQAWSGRWLVQVVTGPESLTTWYAHMQAVSVASGQVVRAGQVIGEVGSLGNSTGCHLHFEVHPRAGSTHEDDVDPSAWLEEHLGEQAGVAEASYDGAGGRLGTAPVLVTANVPFTLAEAAAREQVAALLAQSPDVLLLQEMTRRDVPALVAGLPGSWAVWQPPGGRGGSAIVWDAARFRLLPGSYGAALGFDGRGYDRWLTWAVLESVEGQVLPVVALHMPTGTLRSPVMRAHYRSMTAAYVRLLQRLGRAGHPPVVGGDWNRPLDRAREPWSPVPVLRSLGYSTNWLGGTPCTATSTHGGRIDGFAYPPSTVRILGHGCLDRGLSDHRPVWVAVAPGGTAVAVSDRSDTTG